VTDPRAFDHASFMRDWRGARLADGNKISQAEYDLVMAAIGGSYEPRHTPAGRREPDWLREARALIGTREIPGPRHNSWIVRQWAKLGAAWFNDDETPWCGLFVASCLQAVGLPFPGRGLFARALAWKDWGKPCGPFVGAVAVFGRTGGGHVGFLVGQSANHFYVLGGNQSNAVNIMPIARTRLVATRWPLERAIEASKLPAMTGGTISRNEQ
jgi:uncharacterized protein (TIGR02594 family)